MPGFDGTGPMGQGEMTGGGNGYCAIPIDASGKERGNRVFCGRGGSGRGHRNCFNATGFSGRMKSQRNRQAFGGFSRAVSQNDELAILKNQADHLKNELNAIQARVRDLESK
ncbi:MAG: DUF5320 domain-containing protein [Candidatus Omnitrophota bacterium]